jgi:hypothetical protein
VRQDATLSGQLGTAAGVTVRRCRKRPVTLIRTGHTGQIHAHPQDLHDVTAGSSGYCGGDYLCTAKKG